MNMLVPSVQRTQRCYQQTVDSTIYYLFLYSTMFSRKELKLSSINGTVKGTQPLCPQRVHVIDEHLYNIYGQQYILYRQTKKFQDTINKKCCRLRSL